MIKHSSHTRNEFRRKRKIPMKKRLAIVLCLLVLCSLLAACANETNNAATADSATVYEKPGVDGEESMLEIQTYDIKTPYCTLKYPAVWEDAVTVTVSQQEPYTLSFVGTVEEKSAPLFDLVFDGDTGIVLGTLNGDEPHTISMIAHEIDASEYDVAHIRLFNGMQEDVNIIITNLKKDYDFN